MRLAKPPSPRSYTPRRENFPVREPGHQINASKSLESKTQERPVTFYRSENGAKELTFGAIVEEFMSTIIFCLKNAPIYNST